jgi:signal transduction histidine kinase/CheY-like chemotaxis protein
VGRGLRQGRAEAAEGEGAGRSVRWRLGPESLPITWVAAAFALLGGATMVFVPYEFQTRLFRSVYPSIRTLGLGFLAAGLGLVFGAAWGRRGAARWADLAARFLFIAVLSVLWWQVSIRPGALTGAVAYPLLILAVLLELSPQYAGGKLFRAFATLMAGCFAGLMWLFPADFPTRIFGQVSEVLRPLGGLSLAMAGGFVLLRRSQAAERWLYLGFAGLMGYLAFCLGRRGSWTGMELYLVVGVACLLVAASPHVPRVFNLNTKLLRGMVVAGLLPLIAVGGMSSYFAQRELESTLRADIAHATAADADQLGQELARTRTRLVELASRDSLLKASLARDADFLQFTLERLREDEPQLEQIFVHDRAGNRWASSGGNAVGRNFAQREYHRRAVEREEVYVSTPIQGGAGGPVVVIAVPIKDGRVVRGVLGGVLSLRLMGMTGGRSASAYRMRLIDRRDLRVLRDSGGGTLLTAANLPPEVVALAHAQRPGTLEIFDGDDRRLLVGHAPVPGSDWVVLASQEVASAYRPLTRVSVVVGVSVILAGLLASLLARSMARHFSRRIGTVTGAAQALAEGDLSRRAAPGDDPDEVGTLARSFNDMADRLERSQAQLEQMNGELRLALEARGELMEALRRADRRKDEFLAMLAHELRNPLAAISGAVEAIDRRSENGNGNGNGNGAAARERAVARLGEIGRRQIRHLAHMVDDLLDVSRITTNKITLRREPLDLRRTLESALDGTRALAEARGQTLDVQLPDQPVVVVGDSTRLEQILSNLLHNAVKYTHDGGTIRARLSLTQAEGTGTQLAQVVVTDNGRGISAQLLPNIFDLFVQGDITIDRSEGGLGLGLTLVRRLAEMHGGQVLAASPGPGQGSTFTVQLPAQSAPVEVHEAVAATEAGPIPQSPVSDSDSGETSSRRIVLVDDNQDAALSLKDFLETCGHAVDIAHDGERGRDLILHERPHVAFVDLGLPKLDGFEVARQVRSAGLGQGTRLVALTGYGDPETRKRAAAAGFDAHLVKPVEMSELERLIS